MGDTTREPPAECEDPDGKRSRQENGNERYATVIRDRKPGVVVVELVATVTGRDPTDLDPLYEAVDSDAVDALFEPADEDEVTVTFTYSEYTVQVMSGELVVVVDGRN